AGYPAEIWIARSSFWEDHIFHADREKAVELFHSLKDDPKNLTLNYRLIKADGGIKWIRDRMTVIFENGKPKWIRGLMVDITESKKIEEELSKSEALLKSLVEEMHTSNERYEYINK